MYDKSNEGDHGNQKETSDENKDVHGFVIDHFTRKKRGNAKSDDNAEKSEHQLHQAFKQGILPSGLIGILFRFVFFYRRVLSISLMGGGKGAS